MTADAPVPQECWGLYDASGKLKDINFDKDEFDVWGIAASDLGVDMTGWTIRRVLVTPLDALATDTGEVG